MEYIIGISIGIIFGGGLAFIILKKMIFNEKNNIIKQAEIQGETLKKDKIVEAKELIFKEKEKYKEEEKNKSFKIQQAENRIKQKEHTLNQKLEENNKLKSKLNSQTSENDKLRIVLNNKKQEFEQNNTKIIEELEKISLISKEEAKEKLKENIIQQARHEALSEIRLIEEEAKLEAKTKAKKIIIQTLQRVASEQTIENSISNFPIENESMKGRIIGREGRNIRALEAATGVELIVDDTPDTIAISCFDPVRREICRLTLHQLLADGRLQPSRIEEVAKKIKKQLEEEIIEIGKRTCIDLGIQGMHPELMRIVGRMKYRSSYGQNLLQHSREVANLCATMAAELGLNVKDAKRAGLLHDIGKVPEDEAELPHALLGEKLARKFGENADVCNAIGAHHDEIEMTAMISPIIQVCDAISGARPGARREIVESYIQRIKDLETIALDYSGVTDAYALQAGRELRVIVENKKISDLDVDNLAISISQKIQDTMKYPGQVRVTVIREKRAVGIAK